MKCIADKNIDDIVIIIKTISVSLAPNIYFVLNKSVFTVLLLCNVI